MKRELNLEDIKFLHLLHRLPASRKETPVVGFYQILNKLKSNYTGHDSHLNGYLFEAYYNHLEPNFSHQFKVPVLIWALYNNNSEGPKEITLAEMPGNVIHLKKFGPFTYIFADTAGNETESTSYRAVWDVVAQVNETIPTLTTSNDEIYNNISDELLELDEAFEDELEHMLLEADIEMSEEEELIFCDANMEMFDEETELVFWEANQSDWCISQDEIELLLDQADAEDIQANMNK